MAEAGPLIEAHRAMRSVMAMGPGVTATQRLVLLVLSGFADARTRQAWPSLQTLQEATDLARHTVIDALKALEKRRFITIERGKGRAVNAYTITTWWWCEPPRSGAATAPRASSGAVSAPLPRSGAVSAPHANRSGAVGLRSGAVGLRSGATDARSGAVAAPYLFSSEKNIEDLTRAGASPEGGTPRESETERLARAELADLRERLPGRAMSRDELAVYATAVDAIGEKYQLPKAVWLRVRRQA